MTSPPAPFDTTAIDELVRSLGDRGRALRRDLLTSYVGEGDLRLAEMLAGDHEAARRVAHTMRSSSQVIGLLELADLFEQLERAATADGDATAVAGLVDRSAAAYRTAAAGIRVVLAEPDPEPTAVGGPVPA